MKPEHIIRAQRQGDTAHLSEAGKKGAEVANENRRKEREEEAVFAEFAAEERALEEAERQRSTNEDIISPDGEDLSQD